MAPPKDNLEQAGVTPATVVTPLIPAGVALPDELHGLIDLTMWANALVSGTAYDEPDPNYLSRLLITQTLTAVTPAEVVNPNDLNGLQKIIPNVAHACTGPVEITELYVATSDQKDGTPTYLIFGFTDLETGAFRRTTTGASQLQAQFLRLLSLGVWPIRGNIKRLERTDKGGRFLFWMFPPD
jgi:hypothetical protein